VQGIGIHAAGQNLAAGGDDGIVRPGQPGDAVQEDDHVLPVLHQAFRLFNDHLRDLDVTRCRLVEGGGDDFPLYAPLHVRNFLGAFVDQKHHERDFLMIARDAVGDVLEQNRFSGPGRRHDQSPLPFSDWGEEVHHPGRQVFRIAFEVQLLVGVERGEVVK